MMNSSHRGYVPIDCSTYSEYELAIMHARQLRVRWRGSRGVDRVETLIPKDLRTRTHAEYMIARNRHGAIRVIRLDRIRSFEDIGSADASCLARSY